MCLHCNLYHNDAAFEKLEVIMQFKLSNVFTNFSYVSLCILIFSYLYSVLYSRS